MLKYYRVSDTKWVIFAETKPKIGCPKNIIIIQHEIALRRGVHMNFTFQMDIIICEIEQRAQCAESFLFVSDVDRSAGSVNHIIEYLWRNKN